MSRIKTSIYYVQRKIAVFSHEDIRHIDSAYNKMSTANKEILVSDVPKTKGIRWMGNPFALLAYMVRRDTPEPNAQGDCVRLCQGGKQWSLN